MGKYVLVVDRGSTNVKAVLVDVNGKETAVSSCPSQKPVSLKPGWWEQDHGNDMGKQCPGNQGDF